MAGRPREFDEAQALQKAMQLFWERGYEAAGMSDLLEAMQISRQSCYNTFGDKRALFLKAISQYCEQGKTHIDCLLSQPGSPLANVRQFLEGNASKATKTNCRGCMVVNSIVEFGNSDPAVTKALKRMVTYIEAGLARSLEEAKELGEINKSADPQQLAAFITHVAFGFAALGKIKMCKDSCEAIVTTAMNAIDAA